MDEKDFHSYNVGYYCWIYLDYILINALTLVGPYFFNSIIFLQYTLYWNVFCVI